MNDTSERFIFDTPEGKMFICHKGIITAEELVDACKQLEVIE